ncbi:uncharacterized protein LOC121852802, partial [Callorhinchus milii]|uniref:uncharacterized protein LOC121852802 n=1 Tax=Callorhinchus milii TaxID=7868 RepID=UPI001C3F71A7
EPGGPCRRIKQDATTGRRVVECKQQQQQPYPPPRGVLLRDESSSSVITTCSVIIITTCSSSVVIIHAMSAGRDDSSSSSSTFYDGEELHCDWHQSTLPSEDIWKKFELLPPAPDGANSTPTPPPSGDPSRDGGEVASRGHVWDPAAAVCRRRRLRRLRRRRGSRGAVGAVGAVLLRDCMWSSAASLARATLERLAPADKSAPPPPPAVSRAVPSPTAAAVPAEMLPFEPGGRHLPARGAGDGEICRGRGDVSRQRDVQRFGQTHPPRDEPHNCGVISKLHNGVAMVDGGTVMCVEGVEQGLTGEEEVQLLCQSVVTISSSAVGPVVGEVLDSLPHLPAVVTVQAFLNSPPVVCFGLADASLQVLMFEDPSRPIKAVLQLLGGTLRPDGDSFCVVGAVFLMGAYAGIKSRDKWSDWPTCDDDDDADEEDGEIDVVTVEEGSHATTSVALRAVHDTNTAPRYNDNNRRQRRQQRRRLAPPASTPPVHQQQHNYAAPSPPARGAKTPPPPAPRGSARSRGAAGGAGSSRAVSTGSGGGPRSSGGSEGLGERHNDQERRRRDSIKKGFQWLRGGIPELAHDEKAAKAQILKRAIEYSRTLKREEERLKAEKRREQIRRRELLARLETLKNSLAERSPFASRLKTLNRKLLCFDIGRKPLATGTVEPLCH